ncbi:hypothetical protein PoB_007430000 [Plakobranchus ocellatus]|uniref:Uncharacterized protein n=1 Tax=Plakobranchus ocellatus TaxID=259542 RepID=A0AAV4DUY8_9GAST|nr:hypothetical protein PoB_007430000 [Plakobranchus ocellatus]
MADLESRMKIMMDDKLLTFASRTEGKVSAFSQRVEKMEDRIDKLKRGYRVLGPAPQIPSHATDVEIDVSDASVIKWNDSCCPIGCLKEGQPTKALNPYGLYPLHQSQKVVNPNGLDPPCKP